VLTRPRPNNARALKMDLTKAKPAKPRPQASRKYYAAIIFIPI